MTGNLQGVEQIGDGLQSAIENIKKFDTAMKGFYSNSEKISDNLKAVASAGEGTANSILNGLGGALTALGLPTTALNESLGQIIKTSSSLALNVIAIADEINNLGAEYREMLKGNASLSNSFGLGIDAATEYTDRLLDLEKVNGQLARSNTMLISNDEVNAAFKNLGDYAGNAREQFLNYNGVIGSTTVKAEQMVAVLAKTSGLTSSYGDSAYYTNLNKLIAEQGMTFQEAIESMVDYKSMSKETGLTVETISSSLNGAVSGFSRLGVVVDFAKPALEGFATVMKKVGLGIEEAASLTQTLSSSLTSVANDYGKAYVLFQQGGLDFGGGGGVLGSSIGYRASMLEASPEEQEKIGYDMIGAMRDSLSTFTGGRGIVTVSEAAKSPELQSLYVGQEKILESMYGISGQGDRDRTLELLQQIETANSVGDRDRASQLTEQFQQAQQEREATKSTQEKLGLIAQSSFGEHLKQTYLLQKQLEATVMNADLGGGKKGSDIIGELADKTSSMLSEIDKKAIEAVSSADVRKQFIDQSNGFTLDQLSKNETATEDMDQASAGSGKSSTTNNNYSFNISGNFGKQDQVVLDAATGEYYVLDGSQRVNLQNARRIRPK
jgi:hypothetical protein